MSSTPWRPGADLTGSAKPVPLVVSSLIAAACVLLAPREARAMHLADGALPGGWCLVWAAASLPVVVVAWRRFDRARWRDPRLFPLTAMVAAAVFAISCMPVPIPMVGTCSHPCGTGLAAIVVGPLLTVLVATLALLLQALFLAHGGFTTLGADVLSMGIVGGFVGHGVYRMARRAGSGPFAAAFFAGLLSDWATYATTALELATGLHGERSTSALFGAVCLAFAPTQVPLALLEGGLTAGAVAFLARRRPVVFSRIDAVAARVS